MSPTLGGIVPSIEMVIFCAVGGRLSIIGAVYGALIVNAAKTSFSESFPELWLFAMGGLFIGVVMAFPDGLAGLYNRYAAPKVDGLMTKLFGGAKNAGVIPAAAELKAESKVESKVISGEQFTASLPQGVVHEPQ
jgi:urea transport system permease protein